MDEEKSYYQFLQHLFQEEIYLVSDPEEQISNEEEVAEPEKGDLEPIISEIETLIPEKDGQKVVIVLKESLDKEISVRFNTLLEKLGLTERDTNIVYFSSYTGLDDFEKALLQLKPGKFVLLGAKDAIASRELKEDFSTVRLDDKSVLTMPDFPSITAQKEKVIKCWQALQKFLEG